MRRFKMLLLGVVTALSGVFIACAYGFRYAWDGIVQDKETKAPIPGIKIACMIGGQEATSAASMQDGAFSFGWDERCDSFVFSDVDGSTNGSYATETTSLQEGEQNVVELSAQ